MEKFKYIIIDDEQPTHISVRHQLKNYSNYLFVASFHNPEKAFTFLQENEIDLIFLDIEMPEMDGFQFLEALNKNIFVVILTAYPDKYSLNAHLCYFDKNLVIFTNKAQFSYYLPKIIARFEKLNEEKEVINRINQLLKNEIQQFPIMFHKEYIFFKDILYFMSVGHNIVLKIISGQEEICRMSLLELMGLVPQRVFLRINRNVIINTIYITAFTNESVSIMEHLFRISTKRRKEVVPILQELKQQFSSISD